MVGSMLSPVLSKELLHGSSIIHCSDQDTDVNPQGWIYADEIRGMEVM